MTTQLTLATELKGRRNVRPTDRLVARGAEAIFLLTLLVMLADIPKIGFFPVFPWFFLLPLALFLIFMTVPTLLRAAFRNYPRRWSLSWGWSWWWGLSRHRSGLPSFS